METEDSFIKDLNDFADISLMNARKEAIEDMIKELRQNEAKGFSLIRFLERKLDELNNDLKA